MTYVHGYSEREMQRLYEQAEILEDIIHAGTLFPAGAKVLEAGCGVGAQTRLLVKRSSGIDLTCIDISEKSLAAAQQLKSQLGFEKVTFQQENIHALSFDDNTFDHIFVCFVAEHLDDPTAALVELKRVLKPGGTVTVIEGDHGSCFWHPETPESVKAWNGLIIAQQAHGHDPNIGRRLCPLVASAGLEVIESRPAWLYADKLNLKLRDGMVNHIIVPMVQSAEAQILSDKLVDEAVYQKGIADISYVDQIEDGTFFYTWFKVVAKKA